MIRNSILWAALVPGVLAFGPSMLRADPIGTVTLGIAGKPNTMVIAADSGGSDTYWGVGPVSILATGRKGGTFRLRFDEDGTGPARGAEAELLSVDGRVWQDRDGTLKVVVTRADNLPPLFVIAGRFSGELESDGHTVPITGQFEARLPRQDFAPTPGPDQ